MSSHSRPQRVLGYGQQAREREPATSTHRDLPQPRWPHELRRGPATGTPEAGVSGISRRDDRRVVIPSGEYSCYTAALEYESDPSAPINMSLRTKTGTFYDGDHYGWEAGFGVRLGPRSSRRLAGTGTSSPCRAPLHERSDPDQYHYSFTSLASVQGSSSTTANVDHFVEHPHGDAQPTAAARVCSWSTTIAATTRPSRAKNFSAGPSSSSNTSSSTSELPLLAARPAAISPRRRRRVGSRKGPYPFSRG